MAVCITILTMLGTVGNYALYMGDVLPETVLLLIQSALFIVSVIALFAYRGPKLYRPAWLYYRTFTFRFSLLLLSPIVNVGMVLALVLKWR